ncbi:MAG: sigma-54-dependent Fis family transcriptional regulator [Firmicutes bacterium]|nr:sigma-54-dependent Fis family transcriptional regulator [Bacillota bacterium]
MLEQSEIAVISVADYHTVLRKLEQAWQHFMDGDSYPQLPRFPILESWQRSKEKGVSFNLRKAPLELDDNQILIEKEKRQAIFEAMNPYLNNIVKTFPGDNIAVTFGNEKGIILDCRSGHKMLDRFRDDNYVPGANWSEQAFGTNGIGTALAMGKAVQVFAAEHYCAVAHNQNCLSAPIRELISGVILGVLTITAPKHIIPAHNLNWAISEAGKIEKALRGRLQEESAVLLNLLFEKAGQPAIIYNFDGQICRINQLAQKMLGVKLGDRMEAAFELPGKQSLFSDLVNQSFAVNCRSTGQRQMMTVMPWALGQYTIGGIAFFQPEYSGVNRHTHSVVSSGARYNFASLIGESQALLKMVRRAEKASRVESTILISGETGTGKEILAQAMHNHSRRQDQTFLSVNCGALPKELIGTELFGYAEGAFTGAKKGGRIGKFEAARGGTLFLDEIGDMPLELQAYLLRVLEEGTVTRVGSHKALPVDVRVICATNKNLLQEVALGRFRQDLYYRINGIEIIVPPLRERPGDIPLLAKHFLRQLDDRYQLSSGAIKKLTGYAWPGNVRELKNIIEGAAILKDGFNITAADLPLPGQRREAAGCRAGEEKLTAAKNLTSESVKQALLECSGNVTLAARQLQVSRITVYRKIKQYGIMV